MLGIACRECPPRVVSRMLRVTNGSQALTPRCVAPIMDGEQGNDGVDEARQVVLTQLYEGLVGSPLQSVVEVIARGRGEPSCHARVRGASRDVQVDLAASTPELMVRAAMVCRGPHVAKAVQHALEQGREAGTVQPVTTKPSVDSEGGVGVVIHLLKTREKQINISSIEQRQQTKLHINHNNKKLTQFFKAR
jgi:hypothetical protein